MEALSSVFMWFEAASGLKINLDKNELIPMGENQNFQSVGCKRKWKSDL